MLFQGSYVPCVVGTMLLLTLSRKNQNELARATVLRVDQHIFVGSYAPQKNGISMQYAKSTGLLKLSVSTHFPL
jgi:hypothetical protein